MNIREPRLNFNGNLIPRRNTNRIIIHHSGGSDVSVETIHQWHQNPPKNWAGVGYAYVIRANGNIERGRPENVVGAHAGPQGNSDSIGICLTGDFTKHQPTPAQYKALVALLRDIQKRYPNKLSIVGHKDVMSTACPGHLFSWEKVRELMSDEVKVFPTDYPLQNVVLRGQQGKGVNVDGVICIPAREVARLLGATVEWNATTKTVTIR